MKLQNASGSWRLALGAAAAVGALTMGASAAKALTFANNDIIIVLTKNGFDQIYDFGSTNNNLVLGRSVTFALPSSTQFPAGASGALSEGAVVNVLQVADPGRQEVDGTLGQVPVGQMLFSTTNTNPAASLTGDAIGAASSQLQSSNSPTSGGWLPTLTQFHQPPAITDTANSVLLPTTQNGTYTSSTGPGGASGSVGQNTVFGQFPFTTAATLVANGKIAATPVCPNGCLPIWFGHQGYEAEGGTIPTVIQTAGYLQFSETDGTGGDFLTVTAVVPEPGTLLLLGAGLLGLLSLGSRRKA